MRVVRTSLIALIVIVALLGSNAPTVLAQAAPELTPVNDFSVVSPDQCTGDPANLDRVREVSADSLATPDGSFVILPLFTSDDLIEGPDAAAARSLMTSMLACINANDPHRFLSLFSDDFFRRFAADVVELDDATGEGGTARDTAPLEGGYAIVYESDVAQLDDDRLIYAVAVAWVEPAPAPQASEATDLIQIAAVEIDGVWTIDELRSAAFDDPNEPDECDVDCATPQVTGEGYGGWIMSLDMAREAVVQFLWGEEVLDVFSPTEEEIAEAEAVLPDFLLSDDRAVETGLTGEVATHERQYLGYETITGRILVVNGFCDRLGYDPATEIVAVEDGGSCFWFGRYNLDTGAWESLSINGEA